MPENTKTNPEIEGYMHGVQLRLAAAKSPSQRQRFAAFEFWSALVELKETVQEPTEPIPDFEKFYQDCIAEVVSIFIESVAEIKAGNWVPNAKIFSDKF